MALYDITVDFNGKKAVVHSDPDRFIFVNSGTLCWESGEPFTTEEIIDYMRYYAKQRRASRSANPMSDGFIFMDGQEQYYGGYGLTIQTDENGEPEYKIVDGRILSSRVLCECEETGARLIRFYSKEDYDSFRERLVSGSVFTLLDSTYNIGKTSFYMYRCNKCGDVWLLPPYSDQWTPGHGVLMTSLKNYEKGTKSHGTDKVADTRRTVLVIAAATVLILFIAGLALLLT